MDRLIDLNEVAENLRRNNIEAHIVKTRQQVVPLVETLLAGAPVVTAGGSTTLQQCGVLEHLRTGGYTFLDRDRPGLTEADIQDIYHSGKRADAYMCSCNAITRAGELYNVDGHSNRISSIVHGPQSVIMVAGTNKLVGTLEDAILRVKTLVAPQICKRANRDTYCREKGQCVTIGTERATMITAGCASPQRTCCNHLVCGRQRVKGRIKLVLVEEVLGL